MASLDTRIPESLSPGTRIKASDLLVKALENEGVEYVFGVPGEENLDFLESLRTSKIRLILTRLASGGSLATYSISDVDGNRVFTIRTHEFFLSSCGGVFGIIAGRDGDLR